jgi:antirestriction protein ArdC
MATTQKSAETVNFRDTYQEVTNAVIKALEEGTVAWKCTWDQGLPKNFVTNNNYRGWNSIWLNCLTNIRNYKTPCYLTFKQAQELGGTIKKGERGTQITYWASIKGKPAEAEHESTEEVTSKQYQELVPKMYTVFNIDQTEGIEFSEYEVQPKTELEKITACEEIIESMPNSPQIYYKGNRAYYRRSNDTIVIPQLQKFNTAAAFYSTLFHELAHSTGHESRLNRKELTESDGFGNPLYAKEELTTEMTASFFNAITGLQATTFDNSAAYIENWLSALRNDKTLIIRAGGQAQKAAEFILNVKYEAVINE